MIHEGRRGGDRLRWESRLSQGLRLVTNVG